jgi:hypothetical protein
MLIYTVNEASGLDLDNEIHEKGKGQNKRQRHLLIFKENFSHGVIQAYPPTHFHENITRNKEEIQAYSLLLSTFLPGFLCSNILL